MSLKTHDVSRPITNEKRFPGANQELRLTGNAEVAEIRCCVLCWKLIHPWLKGYGRLSMNMMRSSNVELSHINYD